MRIKVNHYKPAEVFPPGEFILEEMEARGWTQIDLARILNMSAQKVNRIINGREPVSSDVARRLGAAFVKSPEYWLNIEMQWQLYRDDVDSEETIISKRAEFYDLVPIAELERRGWIRKAEINDEIEVELKDFFNVDCLSQIPEMAAAARSSVLNQTLSPAQQAWCRRSLQIAKLVQAAKYEESKIPVIIEKLRSLMREPEQVQYVPKALAENGIRLVIVQHLNHTKLDGAAQWLDGNPVISLSLRYPRMDYFWFTLMHELAHIKFNDNNSVDIDVSEVDSSYNIETRANAQASEWLIPQNEMQSFIAATSPHYGTEEICDFAERVGVHPSLVVGQLKSKGELDWSRYPRIHNVNVRNIIKNTVVYDGWGRIIPLLN